MTFLKSFSAGGSKSSRKAGLLAGAAPETQSSGPGISVVDLHQSTEGGGSGNESSGASQETATATAENLEEPNGADARCEQTACGSVADGELNPLRAKLKRQAQAAVSALVEEMLDTKRTWDVWHDKKGVKIEKTNECMSGSISGRGRCQWQPPVETPIPMDFIMNFMWDDKTKPLYDDATDTMIPLLDIDEECHVVDQVFRGRYGFAGRYFVVVVHKALQEDEKCERAIFAAQSVPDEDLEGIVEICEKEENKNRYKEVSAKLVRGRACLAGFVIEREKATGKFTVAYINDAELKTKGVPKWVVDRVKIDQLRIVENIPACIEKAWKQAKEEAVKNNDQ